MVALAHLVGEVVDLAACVAEDDSLREDEYLPSSSFLLFFDLLVSREWEGVCTWVMLSVS